MKNLKKIHWFLMFWFLLGIVQSLFSEIHRDEAYYWSYSQFLSFGYFDHPPLIAILIKMGTLLFNGTLGVRFMMVVMSTISVYLVYDMTGKDHFNTFAKVFLSIALIHAGSFLATPDAPMVFFGILFFYLFNKYLREDSWKISVFLAITIAALMYSKYHGIIIIATSFLYNYKLLKRPSFWFITFLSLAIYFPHLLWQYNNEFATFKFHLHDRSTAPYKPHFTYGYLFMQLLVPGPITGVLFLLALFFYKPNSQFLKTLKFVAIFIFGFFLLMSFKGKVRYHWTAVALIPIIIIAKLYIQDRENWKKWLNILFLPSIILIAAFRIYFMIDFIPSRFEKNIEKFHHWDKWAAAIEEKAGKLPVVFESTLESPSRYMFETGNFSHSINQYDYNGNNYDFTNQESELQGKTVFFIPSDKYNNLDSIITPDGSFYSYKVIENFRTYNKVRMEMEMDKQVYSPGETATINFTLTNKFPFDINFKENPDYKVHIVYILWHERQEIHQDTLHIDLRQSPLKTGESKSFETTVQLPQDCGNYRLLISLKPGWLLPAKNGRGKTFTICE